MDLVVWFRKQMPLQTRQQAALAFTPRVWHDKGDNWQGRPRDWAIRGQQGQGQRTNGTSKSGNGPYDPDFSMWSVILHE